MRPLFQTSGFRLLFCLLPLVAGIGCCGPMACGPIGGGSLCGMSSCDGPVLALGGGCNHGCSDGGCSAGSCGGCQDGCGELYVDEWINTPPSCDQCDQCGNHQGQSCQACRPILSGFASLWGYRRDPGLGGVSCPPMTCGCDSCGGSSCDSCGGCDSGCSGGCSSCGGGEIGGQPMMEGEYIVEEPYAMSGSRPIPMHPTSAPQVVEAKPAIKPYQPQRTKQIFRPKTQVAGPTVRRSH